MNTHSLTSIPLSQAGLDRRADMRDELIGVMVRHRARRKIVRRTGAALIVVVAVGAGAQIGIYSMSARSGDAESPFAVEPTNEAEHTIANRVEFVTTSHRSIVTRIENVENKVQMIDNSQLWEQLRKSGYKGGLIEIDGRVSLTQSVAADPITLKPADTSS